MTHRMSLIDCESYSMSHLLRLNTVAIVLCMIFNLVLNKWLLPKNGELEMTTSGTVLQSFIRYEYLISVKGQITVLYTNCMLVLTPYLKLLLPLLLLLF